MTAEFKIIPAPPGHKLLAMHASDGTEPAFVSKTMLVGWRVRLTDDGWSGAEPIGFSHPGSNATCFAILLPDGSVEEAGYSSFESESAWVEYMCRLAADLDAAQAAYSAKEGGHGMTREMEVSAATGAEIGGGA